MVENESSLQKAYSRLQNLGPDWERGVAASLPALDNRTLEMRATQQKQGVKRKGWATGSGSEDRIAKRQNTASTDESSSGSEREPVAANFESDDDEFILGSDDARTSTSPSNRSPLPDSDQDSYCFGCEYGFMDNAEKIDGKKMNGIAQLIDQCYGRVDNKSLARMIRMYFAHEIYRPMKRAGTPIPNWTTRLILEHIEEHQLDPRFFIGQSLRKLRRYEKLIDPMICKVDPTTGNRIVDINMLNGYLGIVRKQMELYSKPLKKLNFYDDNCHVDIKAMGGVLRNFKLR